MLLNSTSQALGWHHAKSAFNLPRITLSTFYLHHFICTFQQNYEVGIIKWNKPREILSVKDVANAQFLLLFLSSAWGTDASRRSSHLPKATQLLNGKGRILTWDTLNPFQHPLLSSLSNPASPSCPADLPFLQDLEHWHSGHLTYLFLLSDSRAVIITASCRDVTYSAALESTAL